MTNKCVAVFLKLFMFTKNEISNCKNQEKSYTVFIYLILLEDKLLRVLLKQV